MVFRKTPALTLAELKQRLSYNAETGNFIWIARKGQTRADKIWNTRYAGSVAGTMISSGYVTIRINRQHHYAHRLAVLFMTDQHAQEDVDHINLNKSDNRWENLRLASRVQNTANKLASKNSKSGVKGVHPNGNGWAAFIGINGKTKYLGTRSTIQEAALLYKQASEETYRQFARQ